MTAEFYRNRRVLITGGLGFIGSNLAIELVSQGLRVTLLDSMIPDYGATIENIAPVRGQVTVNFSDVRDLYSLPYLVREQEVIFSLAGQVSHIESMRQPLVDLDINCRSQLSLLECCRQNNPKARLVLASTRQIYGKPRENPVREDHPCSPTDVNGISKLAAEMYCLLYSRIYNLPAVSLRLTNTYGPRMDLKNPKKGFVGVFISRALSGEPIQIYGDGSQRRDFNYVSDVVRALMLAGASPNVWGECYNLGHHQYCSLMDFVQTLNRHLPLRYECVSFPKELKAIDIGDYFANFDKFQAVTGWKPEVLLDEGLRRTVEYYRSG